jgi:hypothetical protein
VDESLLNLAFLMRKGGEAMDWIGFIVGLCFGGIVGTLMTTIFVVSRKEENEMKRILTSYVRKNDEIAQGKFNLFSEISK